MDIDQGIPAAKPNATMNDGPKEMRNRTKPSSAERRWRRRVRAQTMLGLTRGAWRRYVEDAGPYVHNPGVFFLLNVLALTFSYQFVRAYYVSTSGFWSNVYALLSSGAIASLLALCAFWQLRSVRASGNIVMVAVFASAAMYELFHDAQADVAFRLQNLFPLSATELPHAADLGSTFIFATEIGQLFLLAPALWAVVFLFGMLYRVTVSDRAEGGLLFLGASLGMVITFILVGTGATLLEREDAVDVLLARRAIEVDFAQNHLCDNVPRGETVHFMVAAADFGIAVPVLPFPERPFRLIKKTDDDMVGVLPSRSAFHRVSCNSPEAQTSS